MENSDFDFLAKEIVKVFPNECTATYYVPPVPKKLCRHNKGQLSKGRLVDKWKNKRTFIRRSEKKPSSSNKNTEVHSRSHSEGKVIKS